MKITFHKFGILIISESLVSFLSKLTRLDGNNGGNKAMGFAIFPFFIILRNSNHPMTNQWINHERIHLKQFQESLGIYWILSMFEYLYFRVFKGFNHIKAYRYQAIEQEAYLNQSNIQYLKTRKLFNTLKYFSVKKDFISDPQYRIIIAK